jgi:hypothetical protein
MPSILGANTLSSGGYDVDNSVRLDGYASSTRMEVTNSSAGSRQIFTFSTWLKRSSPDSSNNFQVLYSAVDSGGNERIMFEEDKLTWDFDIAGVDYSVETSGRLYRDFSAWYHIVVTKDTTQSTEANRIKMYVNGVQQTLAEIQLGFPDQNANGSINMAIEHQLFAQADGEEFGGYACETVLIDGTAYAADSFGEFDSDSGIWKPIDVSGLTFGTNGFHMNYADSSALGNDVSGNNNDYTTANLAATDQSTDTCTNNFATFNILDHVQSDATYSEGNLKWATTTDGHFFWGRSTIGVSTGKWYAEFKATSIAEHSYVGIVNNGPEDNTTVIAGGGGAATTTGAYEWAYKTSDGQIYNTDGGSSYGNTYGDGAIIGVLLNLDDNEISFSKDGTVQNSGTAVSITAAASTPHGFYFFAVADGTSGTSATFEANFGSPPYAISSGNADANGHGNFEYAVPSGYLALCTKNLAENG